MKRQYLSRKRVTKDFNNEKLLKDIWGAEWGVKNAFSTIRKVVMHRPGQEVLKLHGYAQAIEAGPVLIDSIIGSTPQSEQSNEPPNLKLLQAQFDSIQQALINEGIEVVPLDGDSEDWPERLFTRDLGLVIPGGIILTRLALYIRYGETPIMARTIARLGMPILGMVQGHGFMEGGSFTMLDSKTAVVGLSERINKEGVEQVRTILAIQNIELITIDLPATIIHLDEAFLMVDHNKALVQTALLPFRFLEHLQKRNIQLIHVDSQDPQLTINALTVSPGRVIISSSGKRTIQLLEQQGIATIPVQVDEIFKLGGGIHCVTLPLLRD